MHVKREKGQQALRTGKNNIRMKAEENFQIAPPFDYNYKMPKISTVLRIVKLHIQLYYIYIYMYRKLLII